MSTSVGRCSVCQVFETSLDGVDAGDDVLALLGYVDDGICTGDKITVGVTYYLAELFLLFFDCMAGLGFILWSWREEVE